MLPPPGSRDGAPGRGSNRAVAPFEERLAAGHRLAASGGRSYPPGSPAADQAEAAARDTVSVFTKMAAACVATRPADGWRGAVHDRRPTDAAAAAIAGLLGVTSRCPHVRERSPQPILVLLGQQRLSCQRCAGTRRKPTVPEDECDLCRRPTVVFSESIATVGYYVIVGSLCSDCAARFAVAEEGAA
ncbi:MAG TPA: hypothetical protein VHC49_07050 [Mycobacteriales bacterium]|nr:hypothetical protein [Mycobacteriales bacterium]